MKSTFRIEARRFPVTLQPTMGHATITDSIVISKTQLQAATLVGESSKELIMRHFIRKGFIVLDIGKPERKTLFVDLEALWGGQ